MDQFTIATQMGWWFYGGNDGTEEIRKLKTEGLADPQMSPTHMVIRVTHPEGTDKEFWISSRRYGWQVGFRDTPNPDMWKGV